MLRSRTVLAVAAFAPLVWGTTYVVTTELLPPDRPLTVAALRALPAGLLLLLLARRLPPRGWWWRALVLGALNIGVFFALLFVGAYRLPGGVAATLGAVQPLVVVALSVPLLAVAATRRSVTAGVLGLLGVALLVLRADAGLDPVGLLAAAGGAVSMATGVVLAKRWGRPAPLLAVTSWQLVAGGALLVPVALAVEGPLPPVAVDAPAAAGLAWLALVGTAVAYCAWFYGIGRLPASTVSTLSLLAPLVATALGWLLVGERLTPLQLLGGALVLVAVRLAVPPGPVAVPPGPVPVPPAPAPAGVGGTPAPEPAPPSLPLRL